jgi:hypothetical protein
VYDGCMVESLHVLFTLYLEFKNNQVHAGAAAAVTSFMEHAHRQTCMHTCVPTTYTYDGDYRDREARLSSEPNQWLDHWCPSPQAILRLLAPIRRICTGFS